LSTLPILSLVDYAKKYKISHSNLINKAKRQTIEAFSEKGKWNAKSELSAFQYDNSGVLTTITGATDFGDDKMSATDVMY
jgi:hypothetical protein